MGGILKQVIRFFIRPATFINQLQWSRHHGMILLAFLGIALLESQIGVGRALNLQLSWLLAEGSGLDRDQALFLVMLGRMAFLLAAVFCASEAIWWLVARFGFQTSKRVLYRRLAVVSTMVLASYAMFASIEPGAQLMGALFFGWGLILSYLTFREQYQFSQVTSLVLGILAVGAVEFTWQYSDQFVQNTASSQIAQHQQVAKAKK